VREKSKALLRVAGGYYELRGEGDEAMSRK
jgi:hypothetical protein